MVVQDRYRLWVNHPYFDAATRAELQAIAGNPSEIADRFYRELEFGTGGLRGVIGAGTNRMNRYTVRRVTAGLAAYITGFGPETAARGVVIAHDSRHGSPEFTREAALTLAAAGVPAYVWDSLRPTPLLSFAVRELGAIAGIVITASHNPPQYNGYKVYWEDGGQVPPGRAFQIEQYVARLGDDITALVPLDMTAARARGLLRTVPAAVDAAYEQKLLELVTTAPSQRAACRILYTPLHGAGNLPVRQVLQAAGYRVQVVAAQAAPDPDFSTVRYPNPELPEVFDLALAAAGLGAGPHLIMATDPDADRLGVMVGVPDGPAPYRLLTGNQLGAVLAYYILTVRAAGAALPPHPAIVKTIATSNLIAPMCREHGVTLLNTHTGFKFIGEQIAEFDRLGSHTFLLGFEESYGYLGATFVRDKDGVMAALLAAEAAAHYLASGRTLWDVLEEIWRRYGYFVEELQDVVLPGQAGRAQIQELMTALRQRPPRHFGDAAVAFIDDYSTGIGVEAATGREYALALDTADVLHYRFADGGFVMVRPSGTEPKLKIYYSVVGADAGAARARLGAVRTAVNRLPPLVKALGPDSDRP